MRVCRKGRYLLAALGGFRRKNPAQDPALLGTYADRSALRQGIGRKPHGKFVYPRGLIRNWDSATAEEIDNLASHAKDRFEKNVHIELDLAKALSDADVVIEAMAEEPKAKIGIYTDMKDLMKPDAQVEGSVSNLIGKILKEKIDNGETGVNASAGFYKYK